MLLDKGLIEMVGKSIFISNIQSIAILISKPFANLQYMTIGSSIH